MWKSDNFKDSNQEKKQRADTQIEHKNKSHNFTGSTREKYNIAIVIQSYLKFHLCTFEWNGREFSAFINRNM